MSISDAERWDERYRAATAPSAVSPHPIVDLAVELLGGVPARMLDVACGFGNDGLSMAQRGSDVCLADVSSVALEHVRQRAHDLDVRVQTEVLDTANDDLPVGPWEMVSCIRYLDRDLLGRIGEVLSPGGVVVVAIATTTNLERHERPSARFLVSPDELSTLLDGANLDVVHHDEAWRANGAHEAWVIARRR